MNYRIPFNKPFIVGQELYYMAQSVLSGHTSGDGAFSKKCQSLMEECFSIPKVMLTTSCTSALEMAALLCDLQPGDEVILPSYTFVSTANAFALRGAKLIFVDIRQDTKNLDERLVQEAISERTKVIVPVHYAGVGAEMDPIMACAREHGLTVVEDAAQGIQSSYKGKPLGGIGDLGAFSFHETKNFTCGEGGALLVNRDQFIERAEIIREKGTNRSQFFRGQVDKYTWVDIGSSYLPSDLLAAFLYAQLEHMEKITVKRRKIYELYLQVLTPLAEQGLIELPVTPPHCQSNYHMFYIILESESVRAALIDYLKERGILAVFHYVPLHTSPVGQGMGYRPGMLPITESVSDRLLRLPFYFELQEGEILEVVEAVGNYFKERQSSQGAK